MKLAEALSRRKDLETRISEIKKLMCSIVKVQEGDEPAENPEELVKELNSILQRLEKYIFDINMTNMTVKDEDGKSMTRLLAERDVLGKRIDVMRSIYDQASRPADRYSRNEIKYVSVIDIKPLRQQVNKLSQQYRELDMKIQALNFTNDLIES